MLIKKGFKTTLHQGHSRLPIYHKDTCRLSVFHLSRPVPCRSSLCHIMTCHEHHLLFISLPPLGISQCSVSSQQSILQHTTWLGNPLNSLGSQYSKALAAAYLRSLVVYPVLKTQPKGHNLFQAT